MKKKKYALTLKRCQAGPEITKPGKLDVRLANG